MAEQLKALLRSHSEWDDDLFRSVALQIAAHQASKGHERLAKEIRDLVDMAKRVQQPAGRRAVPIARPTGELSGLVLASYPSTRLGDMVLSDSVRVCIEEIVLQQRQRFPNSKIITALLLPATRERTGRTLDFSV